VAFGDSVATFTYTKDEFPLGFDLTLKKFHVGRYEGTNNPASFESTVDLDDSSRGLKDQEKVISMNRPLVHNGYTCYQSSYVEGARMVSILSIAHDPGGLLAYIGFIGFMIGLVCVITFRQNRPGKNVTGGKS
jgi:cytochrome c biogenesis protein ResB